MLQFSQKLRRFVSLPIVFFLLRLQKSFLMPSVSTGIKQCFPMLLFPNQFLIHVMLEWPLEHLNGHLNKCL